MTNEWDQAHDLNPNDSEDRNGKQTDGYTNLEHYLNGLLPTNAQRL